MNTAASSDEKVMAALAHGSIFLMFLGPVVPVILWASQRKKSKYVNFHALQAMGYQALIFWLWILAMILVMILFLVLIPLLITLVERTGDPTLIPFVFQLPIFIIVFGLIGFTFVTGIVGAVSCLLGREFRYPFLGRWLERYLSYDESDAQMVEAQEDNWVAGICHAMAILQMWGLVTPLIVWFTQKERSAHLRFQAMQASIYQLIALLVYMLGMATYMAFFFGMFITFFLGGAMGSSNELPGPAAFMMVAFFVVMIVFWLIYSIAMPIYYLLAGCAGFRVIRGHHFRYPILGRMIEQRMGPSLPEARS